MLIELIKARQQKLLIVYYEFSFHLNKFISPLLQEQSKLSIASLEY